MKAFYLKLDQIVIDEGTQIRAKIDPDTVSEYSEVMRGSTHRFPPVIVFDTGGGHFLLADGFHRVAAAKKNECSAIMTEVRKGTRADALKFALGANAAHGLRRTNADKHRAVTIALKEWPKLSDRELGRVCGVSDVFVGKVRPQVQTVSTCPRVGADGKKYKLPHRKPVSSPSSGHPPKQADPLTKPSPDKPAVLLPPKPADSLGVEIPDKTLALWNRGVEAQQIVAAIAHIRSVLTKSEKDKDPLYCEVNIPAALAELTQAKSECERAIPYSVCTTCQGQLTKDCQTCKGRGFISEFYWKTFITEDVKTLRARVVAAEKVKV
jgi:hypothetical protein